VRNRAIAESRRRARGDAGVGGDAPAAEALSGAAATLERERRERRAQTTEQGPST
jgi:hypothetical protein